jgi:hypothetical protein
VLMVRHLNVTKNSDLCFASLCVITHFVCPISTALISIDYSSHNVIQRVKALVHHF